MRVISLFPVVAASIYSRQRCYRMQLILSRRYKVRVSYVSAANFQTNFRESILSASSFQYQALLSAIVICLWLVLGFL
jgi:hypothetical protein